MQWQQKNECQSFGNFKEVKGDKVLLFDVILMSTKSCRKHSPTQNYWTLFCMVNLNLHFLLTIMASKVVELLTK